MRHISWFRHPERLSGFMTCCVILVSSALVRTDAQAQGGSWVKKTTLPTLRGALSACVIDQKIYTVGGVTPFPFADLAANEVYDVSSNSWAVKLPMPTSRGFLSVAVVNDTIYAMGGGYPNATSKVEAYNPVVNTWTARADMLSPRRAAQAGVVNGIIFNIGGNQNERNCEAYDPTTNTWTPKKPRPESGGDLAVTVYNGLIYTFGGGYTETAQKNVYAYDPQTDNWSKKADMPTARYGFQTYLVGGSIYAIGGTQTGALKTVEEYDPVSDTWETLEDMPEALAWFAGAVLDNKIYVISGTPDGGYTGTGDIWEYTPTIRLLTASPPRFDFQNVCIGSTSDTLAVVIHNRSFEPRDVNSLSIGTSEFRLCPTPELPLILPPRSLTALQMVFRPTLAGTTVWDTLMISTSDTISPRITIPLKGRGSGKVQCAKAGVLYGISSTSEKVRLYEIERAGGKATSTAMFSPRPPPGFTAMSLRPFDSTLYAAFSSEAKTELYRLSSKDGDLEPFKSIPIGSITAMAFNAADKLFLTTAEAKLYRVDLPGRDTAFIGTTAHVFTGLAFSPATGVLWACVRDTVCTVDTATGRSTIIGWNGWNVEHSSIAFGSLGVLYGLYGTSLVTIGRVWGEAHQVGITGTPELMAIAMRCDVITGMEQSNETPVAWKLEQNYPNPFNLATVINYTVGGTRGQGLRAGGVRLEVYDILGREVAVLVNERKEPGKYTATFDATSMASGVYLYRMTAGSFVGTKKLILLR